jgi:hypothetical protein
VVQRTCGTTSHHLTVCASASVLVPALDECYRPSTGARCWSRRDVSEERRSAGAAAARRRGARTDRSSVRSAAARATHTLRRVARAPGGPAVTEGGACPAKPARPKPRSSYHERIISISTRHMIEEEKLHGREAVSGGKGLK